MHIYRYILQGGGEYVIRSHHPLTRNQLKRLEKDISSTDVITGKINKEDENAQVDRTFNNSFGCL